MSELEIKLGDYFGGDLDIKAKVKFRDLVKQLDPTFIIKREDLDSFQMLKDDILDNVKEPKSIAGRYIFIKGYGFRKSAWGYECLITPEDNFDRVWKDTLEGIQGVSFTAPGDRGKAYFTRYRSKSGGKEDFNPVTKSRGESTEETKRRINY